MKRKQTIWIVFFIVLVGVILVFDSSMHRQPSQLKGGFKEVSFYRNENNTGPVIRIYSVSVERPADADYEGYGNSMPYTLHGTTKVYFFDQQSPAPTSLKFSYPHFDTLKYKALKVYERNGADVTRIKDVNKQE